MGPLHRGAGHRRPVRRSVVQFTVVGLVVTIALGILAGVLARQSGVDQATRSFENLTRVTGASLSPFLDATSARSPQDAAVVTRHVAALRATGSVVRVKVSDATGRVIWSDAPALVGEKFPLSPMQQSALRNGIVMSQVTRGGPANGDVSGTMLEAFVGVRDVHGTPLLVDVFEPYDRTVTIARSNWLRFIPVSLGALIALELVQVPLAWRLAAQLRRSREAEAALLQAAVDASETERRRIAREVHDHVVQDLTAVVYDLDTARLRKAERTSEDQLLVTRTAGRLRDSIADLRTLLVSLMPARLPEADLEQALRALGEDLERAGVEVRVTVTDGDAIPEPVAALLHRCAQESLRNVANHSAARSVDISVRIEEENVTMVVDDDGRGFDGARLAASHANGHLGLRAVGDVVADAGGELTIASAPGQGSRIEVTVPLDATQHRLAGSR
jgi:two-component system, NarL family, sensor kinase